MNFKLHVLKLYCVIIIILHWENIEKSTVAALNSIRNESFQFLKKKRAVL